MENNKVIAEFMGWGENNGFLFPPDDKSMHTIDGWNAQDIPYHRSWDWLMPVVDKMESMGCVVKHHHGDCIVYKIDEKENYRCIIEMIGLNKLENTYKAVVEFIKNQETL